MRNLVFLAFVSLLTLGACEKGPKKDTSVIANPDLVQQDSNPVFVFSFEESSESCKSADSMYCAKVNVQLHLLKGDEQGALAINEKLKRETVSNIGLTVETEAEFDNIGTAAKAFVSQYDVLMATEDKDFITPWDIGVESDLLDQTEHLFSVALNTYTYTGGAHPNYYTTLLTFNQKDGTEIDPTTRIKDEASLIKLVEKEYRNHYELDADENLFEAGFNFENGFTLPENIALKSDGLVLVYNPYEVAPYAAGSAEIFIPKTQLGGIVDFSGLE